MFNQDFHMLNTKDISFYNIISVKFIWNRSMSDYSSSPRLNKNRRRNMLAYMVHGDRTYHDISGHEYLRIRDADIWFVPAKSDYYTKLHSNGRDNTSTSILIQFDIKDDSGNDIIISNKAEWIAHDINAHYYNDFCKVHEAIMQGTSEKLYSKALLSRLMDTLMAISRKDRSFSTTYQDVYPAVIRIERNPQEQIPISELSLSCHLSESAFRRKFSQCMGVPPLTYRNRIRLNKAIELIKSGIYSIERVAEVMGYTDQSYLSKVIKEETGSNPIEIKKLAKKDSYY